MTRIGKDRNRCCVKGCPRIRTASYFRFPMNEIRSRLWVERCGSESLHNLTVTELWKKKRVCELHFAPHAFTNALKIRLNFDAVPSIFSYNYDQATESFEEVPQESNAIGNAVPVLTPAEIPEKGRNLLVPMEASSEEISQDQCFVAISSSAKSKEIPQEEINIQVESSTEIPEIPEISQEQCFMPILSSASTKEIQCEEYDYTMPSSVNPGQLSKTQCYSKPPTVTPVTSTINQNNAPASPYEIIAEDRLPVSVPAKTKQTAKKSLYFDILSSSAITEDIVVEEDDFRVPSPAKVEENLKEKLYSEVLSPNSLNINAKLPSCSQKKLLQFHNASGNELKQNFKRNILKRTLLQSTNSTGKKMFVVSRSPVKPMNVIPESCGLRGCHNDLYSDARTTKKLVKCSSECKRFFHLECTGLEKEEYDILCKNDALRWFCSECRLTLK